MSTLNTIFAMKTLLTLLCAFCLCSGIALADELPAFDLVIRNARFVPDRLEVPANTRFRLNVKNEGPGAEEFESIPLKKEKIIAAGATAVLTFTPLKPGNYNFFGEFHPDTAQGVLVVK
jgi:hypothetical protein